MRQFNGKILLRVPPKVHQELAREAFQKGYSINQICMEALLARKALKQYDPWKSIQKMWRQNRKIDLPQLNKDIEKAIHLVRHEK